MGTLRRKISAKKKLEAVEFARRRSVNAAARKFGVAAKSIRLWRGGEAALAQLHGKAARRSGGGRKPAFPQLEEQLFAFFQEQRAKKLRVSRRMLSKKALQIFSDLVDDGVYQAGLFVCSDGWMSKFMKRHHISLRRVTTTCQKTPDQHLHKIVDFIMEVRSKISSKKVHPSQIFACDETAVWMDALSGATLADTGSQDVAVRTTGHEKSRVTVLLCARANGSKCKPFILLQRKRPIKEVVNRFGNRAFLMFCGTNWMNQELTKKFLDLAIGPTVFPMPRLLVWDKFACHISAATNDHLKKLKLDTVIVPGGCTKFVQAPDVCWNSPFKSRIREFYDDWMASGQQTETAGGNPRPPPLENVVEWIVAAWDALPADMIAKSFKACGLTNAQDGSEDDQIACMQEGRDCEAARQLLRDRIAGNDTNRVDLQDVIASDDDGEEEDEGYELEVFGDASDASDASDNIDDSDASDNSDDNRYDTDGTDVSSGGDDASDSDSGY